MATLLAVVGLNRRNTIPTELVSMICGTVKDNFGQVGEPFWPLEVAYHLIRIGSTDETIILHYHPANATPKIRVSPITLPKPVKAILPLSLTDLSEPYLLAAYGDVIRVYDVSSPESPEVIQDIDAHWHDVTALRLWFRKSENEKGQMTIEPFIISSSLDGTLRRWSLKGESSHIIVQLIIYVLTLRSVDTCDSNKTRGEIREGRCKHCCSLRHDGRRRERITRATRWWLEEPVSTSRTWAFDECHLCHDHCSKNRKQLALYRSLFLRVFTCKLP